MDSSIGKMKTENRRGILGIPPLIFAIIVIIIAGLSWCLTSSYNENKLLITRHTKCKSQQSNCFIKVRKTATKLHGCENKMENFENSNRELSLKISKDGTEKASLIAGHERCVSSLAIAQQFYLKAKEILQVGENSNSEEISDSDYDVVKKALDNLVSEKESLVAKEEQCKQNDNKHIELNRRLESLDQNYQRVQKENAELKEHLEGVNKLKQELEDQLETIKAEQEKRGIQQKPSVPVGGNVKMVIHHNHDQLDNSPSVNNVNVAPENVNAATNNANVATKNANVATNNANVATNNPNVATNNANVATNNANVVTNNPNVATNNANVATNNPNAATNNANVATNNANVATNNPNVATNNANVATNNANVATNNPNVATNNANVATNNPNVATNNANVATNNPNVATNNNIAVSPSLSGVVPSVQSQPQQPIATQTNAGNPTFHQGLPSQPVVERSGAVGTRNLVKQSSPNESTGNASSKPTGDNPDNDDNDDEDFDEQSQ